MKPIIWITSKLPLDFLSSLQQYADIKMWEEEGNMPYDKIVEAAKEATILWTMVSDKIDRQVIESGPNLKGIVNLAVGYNNIDLEAAREKGIVVANTPDVLSETTADLGFSLLMATARRIVEAADELRNGDWTGWRVDQLIGMDLYGATLGVIGMGEIGEALARRGQGFDMKVIYHNRTRKLEAEEKYGFSYRSFEDLLKEADFVVLFTPLTEETKGMIGEKELQMMKKTAILINTARGGVVDEEALYNALKNGDIWAAGSDVFVQEPVPTDHPLLSLKNFVGTPHIGSASIQTRNRMMQRNIDTIAAIFEGDEPPYCVNR